MKARVCVIYTGGTIGMLPTSEGFAPSHEGLYNALSQIHDLHLPDFPSYDLISLPRLLDSSDMKYENWNEIGAKIKALYDLYDGFVVLHGTDTMAYTASALSFMLENLGKAVIITGSQIPLSQARSDGIDNIVTSIMVAASGELCEVAIYFGGKLMRGNRASKVSADSLIAFSSVNYPRLADIGTSITYRKNFTLKAPEAPFSLCEIKQTPIAVIKLFPGIQFSLFESLLDGGIRGVVLEAFGQGNIPSDSGFEEFFEKAAKKDVIIAVCSQCRKGTVKLGAYLTSSQLKRSGVISLGDMTCEAAVTKLYYLFSKYGSADKARELLAVDVRGEIS